MVVCRLGVIQLSVAIVGVVLEVNSTCITNTAVDVAQPWRRLRVEVMTVVAVTIGRAETAACVAGCGA